MSTVVYWERFSNHKDVIQGEFEQKRMGFFPKKATTTPENTEVKKTKA